MKLIAIAMLLICLGGCASSKVPSPDMTPTTVEVTTYVHYECGEAPAVDALSPIQFKWVVLTHEGAMYYALPVAGYEALGLNMGAVLSSARQLQVQRNHYRDCIAKSKEKIP